MKRWSLVVFLIPFTATVSQAQDKAVMEANALLLKAADVETFKPGEAPKYRAEAKFSFLRDGKEFASGTFSSEAQNAGLWHEELDFGPFKMRKVRIKREIWTRQNADFVPPAAASLMASFSMTASRLADSEIVKRIKERKIDGVEARCIEYENISGKEKEPGQICVQADTGYVIYRQYADRATTFSQFSPLGSKMRPHRFTLDFEGTDKLIADVNYVEVEKFDPVGFEPIVDGEVQNVCTTARPPVAKFSPDAKYSLDVQHPGYRGKVTVDVKVGADGHVLNAAVEETLKPELDMAEVAAAKTFLFEPGTCDGVPVTSFTKLVVTYH